MSAPSSAAAICSRSFLSRFRRIAEEVVTLGFLFIEAGIVKAVLLDDAPRGALCRLALSVGCSPLLKGANLRKQCFAVHRFTAFRLSLRILRLMRRCPPIRSCP